MPSWRLTPTAASSGSRPRPPASLARRSAIWIERDVDGSAERFRLADLDVDDMLEGEMIRRGYRGIEEPVY
jgi:hypothetical protein